MFKEKTLPYELRIPKLHSCDSRVSWAQAIKKAHYKLQMFFDKNPQLKQRKHYSKHEQIIYRQYLVKLISHRCSEVLSEQFMEENNIEH
jgi:hypothetical protein